MMKLYLKHQTGQALMLVVIVLAAVGVIIFLVNTQKARVTNPTPQPIVADDEDESSDLLDKDGDGIDDDEQQDY